MQMKGSLKWEPEEGMEITIPRLRSMKEVVALPYPRLGEACPGKVPGTQWASNTGGMKVQKNKRVECKAAVNGIR